MCGFCGFQDKLSKEEKKNTIEKMTNRIIHRGPDSAGYFTNESVAIGFRRLSIIDLEGGSQPIYNEDKTLCVFFNGEIYNYQDIRKDLIEKKHTFTTNSDTEVLVHGYEEYGVELFSKLRGMYAFVIYDIKNQVLIGARDHFGIKPFYYYNDNQTFMFGSEIKSFLSHPNFKKELNEDVLKLYLCYGTNHMQECFFKYTYKLRPGCYFIYKDGKLTIEQYHKLKYEKQEDTYENYQTLVKETLEASIKAHQISDVEIGSYLSGGVDSSYVVASAKPDKTFTVGFDQQGFSEVDYAKDLSKIFGVNNYSKLISGDEFFDILPTVQYHCDEPSANVSTVPLYYLSKLAREQVKVVLSGEGADEMFGGYNEYNVSAKEQRYLSLPLAIRKMISTIIKPLPHFPGKNTLIKYGNNLERRYYNKTEMFSEKEANRILQEKYQNNRSPFDLCKPFYDEVKDIKDEVLKKMYIDINFWLPNDILLKADKMSMANSVELRVPLLDVEVWKLSKKLPTKYMVRNGQTKEIFRSIAKEKLPEEWSKRRKLGFPVPFGKWVKEEKYYNRIKEIFNSDYAKKIFDVDYINNLLEEHHNGNAANGKKIYVIYVFLIWYKRFFIDEVNN